MLGGFHFNDRKYADDDLTLGQHRPVCGFSHLPRNPQRRRVAASMCRKIAYMIDQIHNLKPKIEAMIQTVVTAQELYLKACLVDREKLRDAQEQMDIVDAEEAFRSRIFT